MESPPTMRHLRLIADPAGSMSVAMTHGGQLMALSISASSQVLFAQPPPRREGWVEGRGKPRRKDSTPRFT